MDSVSCHMCQLRLLLRFSELGYDLCSAAFRPFLLWDCIVGTQEPGLATVGARMGAITPNLIALPSVGIRDATDEMIWNGSYHIIPYDDGRHHMHAWWNGSFLSRTMMIEDLWDSESRAD